MKPELQNCLSALADPLKRGMVDISTRELPPGLLLLLVVRLELSGRLLIEAPGLARNVWFKAGRIHELRGEVDLLSELGPGLDVDDALSKCFHEAVRQGFPPQVVMRAAANGIGRALCAWTRLDDARILFDPSVAPPAGSFPIEGDPIRMLEDAFRHLDRAGELSAPLLSPGWVLRAIQLPPETHQARRGFDTLTVRVLSVAEPGMPVDMLISRATGSLAERRPEVAHRVFVLSRLGVFLLEAPAETMVRTRGSPKPVDAPWLDVPDDPTVEVSSAPRSRKAEEPAENDAEIRLRLDQAVNQLLRKSPLERMELDTSPRKPTPEEIGNAFRKVSQRYHPDRFVGGTTTVRSLASRCFSLVQEAADALQEPEIMAEQWRKVECERSGTAYVSLEAQTRARISYKKAEGLIRTREYDIAEALLAEAMRLDPLTIDYAHQHAYVAFMARQMTAEDAERRLDALKSVDSAQRAAILVTIGTILKTTAQSPERYLARFQEAVSLDPANRDAERELRLHDRRQEKRQDGGVAASGSLLGRLLGRKPGKA
jgi:hypothetical protein